ncbi:dihydrodipicolinate synthase family protein [Fulvimarina sp. 2208YS6-2-32]|uniref:Dihydrodipicolinate synthase family protein n=1 Tax=Fulvimarina uroteuthidis TaxID=3098149 RepID=A0ABU5HZW8_9HYPH|nr:dihydrodipicolinate synthase family protein [Fulvimarina sp. 2208YS6-2-32]MDY8108637.1 dihydrodipicolinate synthase family protein [Fulvimarina sp. 2208YS6-2-32]
MSSTSPFHGLSVFPITPTDASGRVDVESLCRLLERICEAGPASIGLLGSTGNYAYLTRDERWRAIEAAVACVDNRLPIIVGVGALRTDEAIGLARDAEANGADALLMAPVSYAPLTDEEAYQHYRAVAGVSGLPFCIYDNPSTTRFTFSHDLVARLSEIRTIEAIKMPARDGQDVAAELAALRARTDIAIGFSCDWHGRSVLMSGADAWYSVIGGIMPKLAVTLARAATSGDAEEALRIDAACQPLWNTFRSFGSLRVVTALLDLLDLGTAELPRPLLPLGPAERARVEAALAPLSGDASLT